MAELSANPTGQELEDFVAAHFVSRGVFVEFGVTQRDPTDILELDIVWTDYRDGREAQTPVEVKSGDWGIGDIFKYYGWTRYLELPSGQFVCRTIPSRTTEETVRALCKKLNIELIHVPEMNQIDNKLQSLGLPHPSYEYQPSLWRYSFWSQRRFLKSLNIAISRNVCPESAKTAKNYSKLINDAIFFESDVRARVELLLETHLKHRHLARTAANELAGKGVIYNDPPRCEIFDKALYQGQYLPVQACLYLAHRARLSILKAAIDYKLAKDKGQLSHKLIRIFNIELDLNEAGLFSSFKSAVDKLSTALSFKLFPIFWQVYLWGWGGFILTDRKEDEYSALSAQTGVPVEEIDIALSVFDELFPSAAPWHVQPSYDTRSVLKLMPAAMRGIGAYSRTLLYGIDKYKDFGFKDETELRMGKDHNTCVRLLDGTNDDLIS
jgi:hypothetical protein